MSYVGKNIKKIRSVKNLNQSDFADLFALKRASIGSYEEGRAEPKIATLIEIAKYFGISVDDLLNKQLSVNDLLHFDIFKKDYVKSAGNQLKPTKLPQSFTPIHYISSEKRQSYFKGDSLESFQKLSLPLPGINSDYLAFEPHSGLPWIKEDGSLVDMLIVRELKDPKEWSIARDKEVLLWEDSQFLEGKIALKDKKEGFRDFRTLEFKALDADNQRLFLVLYELANILSNK